MNGFSYNNIFDTKGIEYIIVIAFLLLLIPFWLVLNRKVAPLHAIQQGIKVLTENLLQIPQGIFLGKNHTWAFLERTGIARIGLDNLLMHITGSVEVTHLKKPGDKVKKGEAIAEIIHEGKSLRVLSPLTGEIKSANSQLNADQTILESDPYGKGWVYTIRPYSWLKEISEMNFAADASDWLKRELSRYKDFLSVRLSQNTDGSYATVLQDGGELIDNSLSDMPESFWTDFQKDFMDEA